MRGKILVGQQESLDVLDDTLYGRDDQMLRFFEKSNTNFDSAKFYQALSTVSGLANVIKNWPQGEQLVAQITKEGAAKLASGEWKLVPSKRAVGNYLPNTVSAANGKFAQQFTMKPQAVSEKLSMNVAQLGMQFALQGLIQQVINQLEILNAKIDTIERGQRNDRIAMYYSAKQHCLQALLAKDEGIKKQLFLAAASKANDAMCMLMETCLTDIKEMQMSINDDALFNNRTKCCEEKSRDIFEALVYINNALRIEFNSYKAVGEEDAAYTCLKLYQRFLKDSLMRKIKYKEISSDLFPDNIMQEQEVRFMLHSYGTLYNDENKTNIDFFLNAPPIILEKLDKVFDERKKILEVSKKTLLLNEGGVAQ